jgi:hypothetical protein
MKNFKPGEQVVFSTKDLSPADMADFKRLLQIGFVFPMEMEVVTISQTRQCQTPGFFALVGYSLSPDGKLRGCAEIMLFPLAEISRAETEKILDSLQQKQRAYNISDFLNFLINKI